MLRSRTVTLLNPVVSTETGVVRGNVHTSHECKIIRPKIKTDTFYNNFKTSRSDSLT